MRSISLIGITPSNPINQGSAPQIFPPYRKLIDHGELNNKMSPRARNTAPAAFCLVTAKLIPIMRTNAPDLSAAVAAVLRYDFRFTYAILGIFFHRIVAPRQPSSITADPSQTPAA